MACKDQMDASSVLVLGIKTNYLQVPSGEGFVVGPPRVEPRQYGPDVGALFDIEDVGHGVKPICTCLNRYMWLLANVVQPIRVARATTIRRHDVEVTRAVKVEQSVRSSNTRFPTSARQEEHRPGRTS